MHWAEAYIGLPYVWNGYTRAGVYCWGLVCLVQREVFGRTLPKYPHGDEAAFAAGIGKLQARPVEMDEAASGDVLMMRANEIGNERHIGVFVDRAHVLHIEEGAGSLIERVKSTRFQWRPIRAYRLPSLSA